MRLSISLTSIVAIRMQNGLLVTSQQIIQELNSLKGASYGDLMISQHKLNIFTFHNFSYMKENIGLGKFQQEK